MADLFPYSFGPTGRYISVDTDGKIVATSEVGQTAYVYGYGDTGRALAVDASGRLILSSLSNIVASSASSGTFSEDSWRSLGSVVVGNNPNIIGDLTKYNNALYQAVGVSVDASGYLYKIEYDENSGLSSSIVFAISIITSGVPKVLSPYRGNLYIGLGGSSLSGYIFKLNTKDNVTFIGAVSGYNPSASNQVQHIEGMGIHDNKLIIGIRNSPFGATEQPVFYYDETNFGELCRIKTDAATVTDTKVISFGNRLFAFQNTVKSLTIFDGIRKQYYDSGSISLKTAAVYNNKLYFGGSLGLYEWDDDSFAIKKLNTGGGNYLSSVGSLFVYNNKLYIAEQYVLPTSSGVVRSFNGDSFKCEYAINGAVLTEFAELNGRLFLMNQIGGNIYTYRASSYEALRDCKDKIPHTLKDNKEYIKNLFEYVGNKYQERDAQGALIQVDTQQYPIYTSNNITQSNEPLSSGITRLDQKLGPTSTPPSGLVLPSASSYNFGDQFYVIGSGFYRRGISDWE